MNWLKAVLVAIGYCIRSYYCNFCPNTESFKNVPLIFSILPHNYNIEKEKIKEVNVKIIKVLDGIVRVKNLTFRLSGTFNWLL